MSDHGTTARSAFPRPSSSGPKDKHELGPELIVSDENGSFNLGAGLGYTHRNFFGGARIFTTHAPLPDTDALGVSRITSAGTPTRLQSRPDLRSAAAVSSSRNRIKGSWSFSFILDKQKPYLQNIFRNKFGFTSRFAEYTNGFLDWTLEAIGSETERQLQRRPQQIRRSSGRSGLLQEQQFNSILSFTIQRDMTNDLFSPSEGFIHSATIDEAGLFPLLLQGVFPNLPFTQFYRVSLIGRWYTD